MRLREMLCVEPAKIWNANCEIFTGNLFLILLEIYHCVKILKRWTDPSYMRQMGDRSMPSRVSSSTWILRTQKIYNWDYQEIYLLENLETPAGHQQPKTFGYNLNLSSEYTSWCVSTSTGISVSCVIIFIVNMFEIIEFSLSVSE